MPEWKRVVRADRVREGTLALGFMGVKKVAVTRVDGELRAFNNACPHAGSPLSGGQVRDGQVTCSRHQWAFDMRTGACPEHPIYALRLYEAREADGWIEVAEPEEIW